MKFINWLQIETKKVSVFAWVFMQSTEIITLLLFLKLFTAPKCFSVNKVSIFLDEKC